MIVWAYWRCDRCGRYSTSLANPHTHRVPGSLTRKPRHCRGRYQIVPPVPIEVRW